MPCNLGRTDLSIFTAGTGQVLREYACAGVDRDCEATITSACGQAVAQDSSSAQSDSRRLQSQDSWEVYFEVSFKTFCNSRGCTNIDEVEENLRAVVDSGDFASNMSSNPQVSSVLERSILECLVVWMTVFSTELVQQQQQAGNLSGGLSVSSSFYPVRTLKRILVKSSTQMHANPQCPFELQNRTGMVILARVSTMGRSLSI